LNHAAVEMPEESFGLHGNSQFLAGQQMQSIKRFQGIFISPGLKLQIVL
jgi:hypothetical protein